MDGGRLPNLLVVGVPKAGTGSLFAYLTQHSEICGADKKEVGYFNYYNPRRYSGVPPSLDVYRKHFAQCANERYAMEATPTYSYGGQPVIDAIQASLDRPKIILTLRNPVDRLWSAYTFQRSLGNINEFRSFDEYLKALESRKRDGSDLVPHDRRHGLYIGYYADYVPLWLDAFGADIKVVFAEDLARDTAGVVADILRWLEVDDAEVEHLDLGHRNPTRHPRSTGAAKIVYRLKRTGDRLGVLRPSLRKRLQRAYLRANAGAPPQKMEPQTRRRLEELYRTSSEETAEALMKHGAQDLPSWLQVGAMPKFDG